MSSNRLQVTELDFDNIKNNLKQFLKNQTEFTDYDFEGSGLNVLLDVLAYNTHYNAFYLNMVANESFMDTALLRTSVVSHAKLLGYTPKSSKAPRALVDLTIPTNSSLNDTITIPRGFEFKSELVDGTSYNFVTLDDMVVDKVDTSFYFKNMAIYEGKLITYRYNYNENTNPKAIFTIPDVDVDISTIRVSVQSSSSNLSVTSYTISSDVTNISSDSKVFFIQEGSDLKYEIYFGDGVIGKKISDGNIINISYLVTNGTASNKANSFVVSTPIGMFDNYVVDSVSPASGGADRETLEQIKHNSIQQFNSQDRIITYKDYESHIIRNYPVVESISVWGGEDNEPPVYGRVFISIKPKNNYFISTSEKQRIIDNIIKPKSIISVKPEIIDPEYLFLKVKIRIKYDSRGTLFSEEQLRNLIKNNIIVYSNSILNRFDTTFVLSKIQDLVNSLGNGIIGSDAELLVEKHIAVENKTLSYTANFNVPLYRGASSNRLTSSEFKVVDVSGNIRNAIIEEVPESYTGIYIIDVVEAGYGYTEAPQVTITGDGYGATAIAHVVNGRVNSITITNRGINYTKAVITINGGNGYGAKALAIIDARYGTLRTVYFNENAERQIINANVGTIDYDKGIVTLNNIKIIEVNDVIKNMLKLSIRSNDSILKSKHNMILTLDATDASSIIITLSR